MKHTTKLKRIILYWLVIAISAVLLYLGYQWAVSGGDNGAGTLPTPNTQNKARITEIIAEDLVETDLGGQAVYQWICYFKAEILDGEFQGEIATIRQSIDENMIPSSIPVQEGDEIYVTVNRGEDGSLTGTAGDYVRTTPLYLLVGGFLLLLLIFGRKKGVNTIISLAFTCLAVFIVFVPAILNGYNPMPVSILVCIYIIFMTLLICNGFTFKTAASALGCIGGVLVAGVVSYSMEYILKLTGMVEEQSLLLTTITENASFDFRGLIFAEIIIGALGAVMDVSMDIASALEELISKVPELGFRQIIKSGMKVGRDVMGTMANTLILAYAGGSLSTIMLITVSGKDLSLILNGELISVEILKAMAGSIGILFTIPITAIVTALLHTEGVHWRKRRYRRSSHPAGAEEVLQQNTSSMEQEPTALEPAAPSPEEAATEEKPSESPQGDWSRFQEIMGNKEKEK